jgi:hypothetical protein
MGRGLLGAVVALLIIAQPAGAQGGRLAFDFDGEVFLMRVDGSDREQLTRTPGEAESGQADFNADGTLIAYARGDENGSIWVQGNSEATARRITRPGRRTSDGTPDWRADGLIVFGRFTVGRTSLTTSLVTVDPTTGRERVLKTLTARERIALIGEPVWSPDGSQLLYTRTAAGDRAFEPDLYVMDVASRRSRKLADAAQSGAWSPDGTRIAFSSVRDRNGQTCGSDECFWQGDLYVMNADGSGQTRLTREKGDDGSPVWAPDGSAIVFHSSRNAPKTEGHELYAIRPDGSCLTWLTNGALDSRGPDWQLGSGGLPEPFECGAVPRAPMLLPTPRVPGLWLGPTGPGNTLLYADDDGFLPYGDCAAFDPAECGPSLDFQTGSSCLDHPLREGPEREDSFEIRRGALVYRGSGVATVYSGPHYAKVYSVRRDKADVVIDALRPLPSADPVASLEPPRFRASVIARVERARRLGSVGRVAREMRRSRRQARHLLELAQALEPFGKLQPADC